MPVLEYCGFLYNGVASTQHKQLQLTQNRGIRVSLNAQLRYTICNLHLDSNVDELRIWYNMQLSLLLHKYLYG